MSFRFGDRGSDERPLEKGSISRRNCQRWVKRKLGEADVKLPWDEIIRDTSAMRAVTVRLGAERYLMRTALQGCAGAVFRIAGVKVPPLAQPA